jgi:hypothetical protein
LRPTRALALVPLTLMLAACGPIAATSTTPPAAGPTAAPPTTAPQTPGPQTPQPPAAPAGVGRCAAAHLKVTVTPGDSAAGHVGLRLVFTNTSAHSCTIYGYPGVSFLSGPTGHQINDPAQRSTAEGPSTTVTVAPHGKAHADLLLVNVDNFPAANCKPIQAAGVRVYPPDDTKSLYARSPQQVCSVKGAGLAQIYPVRAGASST